MKQLYTLCAVLATALPALSSSPVGIANVYGAASWESLQKPPYGMYSFELGTTASATQVSTDVVPANFGAVYVDGRYFAMEGIATSSGSFITNYLYDAETWQKITDFRGENITAFDMAWDETTGNVYGYFHRFDTGDEFFGTIDINTGRTTSIATLPFAAYGLGCDVEGQLYAIAKNGDLYKVNKTTGATTRIASTPCASAWTTSGTIDSSTRTFYYACCNDTETVLYGVNIDTGVSTRLQTMPDNMEFHGLYLPEATALPGAPSKAENVSYDFSRDSLTGHLRFTVPSLLNGGETGVGQVNYTVTLDGNQIGAGQCAYGADVEIPLTVATAGDYTAKVFLSNTIGSAPVAKLTAWIGLDTPAPVGTVSITYDGNGEFTLSWAEARSLHGGWFDPATVTYTVQRYNSESNTPTTYTGLTETTFVNSVSLPSEDEYATYHYNVAAVFGNVTGSYTSSEFYTIGSLTPPFYEPFNYRYDLGKFTIFEGEVVDQNRWAYDNRAVTLTTDGAKRADDYLLLPPLTLSNSMRYLISFDAKGKYSTDVETFEVLAGVAPTVEALNERVMDQVEMKSVEYQTYSAEFIPATDGAYFIAIHGTSAPFKGAITIDNIRVSEGTPTAISETEVAIGTLEGAAYYTLQGMRVYKPAKGLYIRVCNGKAQKVMIK